MKNNFDFLRLLFAIFVLISHSWPLSGLPHNDWLMQLTGSLQLSEIGVHGFFIISGYLIYQSLCRSKSVANYYYKRILRLVPALLTVLCLTVVLGSFVYEGTFSSYLHNRSVWTYIPNNLFMVNLQYSIQGIFTHNPFKEVINGSLWTIPYEFFLYILLSFPFFFNTFYKKLTITLVVLILLIGRAFFYAKLSQYGYILQGGLLMNLGICFFIGSFMAAINFPESSYTFIFSIISAVVLCIFIHSDHFELLFLLLLPFIVIPAGTASAKFINEIGHIIGDLSYGIYIYAFVVQQTLMHFFNLDYVRLMIYSLLITLVFAWLSWHVIEKNALRLKTLWKS